MQHSIGSTVSFTLMASSPPCSPPFTDVFWHRGCRQSRSQARVCVSRFATAPTFSPWNLDLRSSTLPLAGLLTASSCGAPLGVLHLFLHVCLCCSVLFLWRDSFISGFVSLVFGLLQIFAPHISQETPPCWFTSWRVHSAVASPWALLFLHALVSSVTGSVDHAACWGQATIDFNRMACCTQFTTSVLASRTPP